MTRLPALAVAALLLAALAGAASAGVMVTSYRVTPDVLAPGSDGLLTVTNANGGGSLPGANASGDPVIESVRLHTTDLTVLSGDYEGIGLLRARTGHPDHLPFPRSVGPGDLLPRGLDPDRAGPDRPVPGRRERRHADRPADEARARY